MAEHSWVAGFLRHQQLRESIASVALSHPASCDCRMCRAAKGDEAAFVEVLDSLNEMEGRRADG